MQSKRNSAAEAFANLIVGVITNLTINGVFVFFFLGMDAANAVKVGGILSGVFLVTSTVRSYVIRRIFNNMAVRNAKR